MSKQLAREISLELHYGIMYMYEHVKVTGNTTAALHKLIESRGSIERYGSFVGGKDFYPSHLDVNSKVIELDQNLSDSSISPEDTFDDVSKVKFVISGLSKGLDKIISLRMSRLLVSDPIKSYRAIRSLDRANDSLESCISYLREELFDISKENPGVYPSSYEGVLNENDSSKPEDAITTNEIMESRASNQESSNEDIVEKNDLKESSSEDEV